ncbi:hypothetical protein IKG10_02905 [Candidatus Saccharibacteria bacterium]|nr:hypothetical protein [Candidatus Saccharibacteria bacterium]
MRNYGNDFNEQTKTESTGWEIIEGGRSWQNVAKGNNQEASVDDFEQRRNERIKRREERLKRSKEATASMMKKAATLVASAIATIALVSALIATGVFSRHDIMNGKGAEAVEIVNNVESIEMLNGPNIRTNPHVSGREELETWILKLGEEGQIAKIPWQKEVLLLKDEYDPNGPWIGLEAEEFAKALYKGNYITSEQAEKIIDKEKNGDKYVWMSLGNARCNTADDKPDSNSDSISNLNSN